MKNLLFSVIATFVLLTFACKNESKPASTAPAKTENSVAQTYACPMKCEGDKTYAAPGSCPVCKMDLKPVESAAPAVDSTHQNHSGHKH